MPHDSTIIGRPKGDPHKTAKCRGCGEMYDPKMTLSKNLADKCTRCLRGMVAYMQDRIEYLVKQQQWHPVGNRIK